MKMIFKKSSRTDAAILAAFMLTTVFTGCKKTESNASLSEHPQTVIAQENTITLSGVSYDATAKEITVTDGNFEELHQQLSLFQNLEKLTLEGSVPSSKNLLTLQASFPEVIIVSPVTFGDISVCTDVKVLDLSQNSVASETLQSVLPLFFQLEELTITGTGFTDQEAMALSDSMPGVLVRCELPLAGQRFLTDSTQLDISGCEVTVEEVDKMLPYFPRLKKLDMSFCGITDEEMDALNQRHPETDIVWTLDIGMAKTRTDAVYFYPAEINYYPTNEEMKKLRYCTELIAIDIGHTRATDCEFLWYTPNVRYLILADTGITDISPVGNLKELIYLELFNLRTKDYSPLLYCTKLQDLNIGTTHADPEPLSKMTWLHNLQWHRADQDPSTKEAVLKLPEQLPDTNVELYPRKKARNIGGGWRYIPNYYVFRDIIGATYYNQDQIWDYWGKEDGDRIMACESGNSFSAYTLADIVAERLDSGEPIIGLKNNDSEKAQILYQTLVEAESWITKE